METKSTTIEKIVHIDGYMNIDRINVDLKSGNWTIKSITALYVSTGSTVTAKGGALIVLIKTNSTSTKL